MTTPGAVDEEARYRKPSKRRPSKDVIWSCSAALSCIAILPCGYDRADALRRHLYREAVAVAGDTAEAGEAEMGTSDGQALIRDPLQYLLTRGSRLIGVGV